MDDKPKAHLEFGRFPSVQPSPLIPPAISTLVWEDDTPGNAEIYYKKSTNGGRHVDDQPKAHLEF